jgi:PAS domain-containing protein
MQFNWRAMSGPALTAAIALLGVLMGRHLKGGVPSLAPLFVCIVAFAGSLDGLASAATSAAIAIGCMALFLFDRTSAGFDPSDMIQLAMLSIAVGGTAGITGLLRQRWMQAFASESGQHATAENLSAALDQVDFGIVLLDAETRAEFINHAFREYFSLPDEKADSKPPFIALMCHGRDTRAYELPEDELNAYVARRIEMVRAGDATPINIRLADGRVLRFTCTALPDGGRMLSYTPVTDLIRHDDDPDNVEFYHALRGGGLIRHLNAAE